MITFTSIQPCINGRTLKTQMGHPQFLWISIKQLPPPVKIFLQLGQGYIQYIKPSHPQILA